MLGLVLWATQVWAATYYVDPTCNSSGDGTTTTCGPHGPFKTWAKVKWAAGNTYSQKGGTTAYEQITVGASGTSGNVITINSYGSGNANLNGGVTIPAGSWKANDPVTGVYSQNLHSTILENGVYLKNSSNSSCSDGNYYWVWYEGKEYYKPTSGTPADHVVENVRRIGVELGMNNYITITGFNFTKYRYGITGSALKSGKTNNHIIITNNTFSDVQFGVWINFNNATSQGITVSHNTFDYVMSSIELQGQGDCNSQGIHSYVEISHNTIAHCSKIRGVNAAYNWDDVDTAGWDKEGIGFQNLSNSNIHHNTITGFCRGIVLFTCANGNSYNNNFYKNYINTDWEMITFAPRTNSPAANSFYNNNAYYNVMIGGRLGYAAGMFLGNLPNSTAIYNKIYNNTIIPSANGIWFPPYTDYYDIKNNIIYGGSNYTLAHLDALAPSHMIYDYNLYLGKHVWSGPYIAKSSKSWAQWKALGTNYDAHSPAPADPLFTNAARGVYTLTTLSPAKWAGVNVGLKTDYVGKPVHDPPSIGAYEYVTITAPTKLQVQ